jgi:hypothetical protein
MCHICVTLTDFFPFLAVLNLVVKNSKTPANTWFTEVFALFEIFGFIISLRIENVDLLWFLGLVV